MPVVVSIPTMVEAKTCRAVAAASRTRGGFRSGRTPGKVTTPTSNPAKPLDGFRVLIHPERGRAAGRAGAGRPGAEVIKVEAPGGSGPSDHLGAVPDARPWPPTFAQQSWQEVG